MSRRADRREEAGSPARRVMRTASLVVVGPRRWPRRSRRPSPHRAGRPPSRRGDRGRSAGPRPRRRARAGPSRSARASRCRRRRRPFPGASRLDPGSVERERNRNRSARERRHRRGLASRSFATRGPVGLAVGEDEVRAARSAAGDSRSMPAGRPRDRRDRPRSRRRCRDRETGEGAGNRNPPRRFVCRTCSSRSRPAATLSRPTTTGQPGSSWARSTASSPTLVRRSRAALAVRNHDRAPGHRRGSRGRARPPSGPRAARARASSMTVGVFIDPPMARPPTLITGERSRSDFKMPRA